ncbi:uncharacterized protein LOC106470128 isoform X2 [Limulus polyphemus]|uniref:Uncharacterized protein LOC106470128 isoform X2 n=1 Tax=Limulus polyphemus TaxID=6850 RepID=A0ABM1BPE7_LIMPO|nr:uncharacterized protein LOC106470128 isoform X2 [Limulus polyphemus]
MEFSKNNKNCDSLPNKARNDTGDQQPQERDLMNKDAPNSLESESQRCISSYFEKIFFPTMLVFGIYELAEYIGKISGDSHATKKYFVSGEFHLFVISLTCLLLPVITYTVYRVFEAFARGGDSFSHIPEEISGVSHNDEKFNKVCTLILHGLLIIPWQIRKTILI